MQEPLFRDFLMPLVTGIFTLLQLAIERMEPRHVYTLMHVCSLLAWYGSPRHANRTIRNIELAYGDRFTPEQRRAIGRNVVRHFFCTCADTMLLPRVYFGGRWRETLYLTDDQYARMQSLAGHDGPVAFHTGHMGCWEFAAGLAGCLGRKLALVYRPLEIPGIDEKLRNLRTVFGNEAYPKHGALRGYTRTLRAKGWLGVIADQNSGKRAAFLDFFGLPVSTEVSYFPLYQRYKPRVAALFVIREGFEFKFHLEGPYETHVNPDAPPLEEALRLGQWYIKCIENVARRYPEQYLWTHKRFTSRPPGAPSLYDDLGQPVDPASVAAQPRAPIAPADWAAE